jgi:hypothetical protein
VSDKEYTVEGLVEYFEGLVAYMRKLGYEDTRDKRIRELEERIMLAREINYDPTICGYIGMALRGTKLEDMPEHVQAIVTQNRETEYDLEALNDA